MFQERRDVAQGGLELRDSATGSGYTLRGYASTWQPYEVTDALGTYTETIRNGAFTKTLNDGAPVYLLENHGGLPLASTKSGTLRLWQDEVGLGVEADLDHTSTRGSDVAAMLRRGDADKMSFAFTAMRQKWDKSFSQRDVSEAKLYEVSVVTFPANDTTTVGVRSAATARFGTRQWSSILAQVRAGTLDDVSRDILLQIIGALDSAAESIEDATEVLEELAQLPDDADASDIAEALEGEVEQNAAQWPAEYRWFAHSLKSA